MPAAVNPCNKALSLGGPTQLWVFGKRSRTGTLDYDPAGLWRVDPTAATPTAVEVTGVPLQVFRAGKNDQSSYDICIAVHPDHPERLLVGGSTVLIGGVWSASLYSLLVAGNVATPTIVGDGVHADLHVVRFGPRVSPLLPVRSVWVGCDGGVFSSIADGVNASFRSRNHELSTLEPGFVACHPTNDGIIAAGMQDNGTCLRVGDTLWGFVNGGGGDGGGTVFDPGTTNRHFMQYTQNSWTSSDGSSTGFLRFPKPDGDPETSRSLFYSGASALVHGGLTNLLVGSDRPWYSPDWGQTWVTIPSGKDPRKTANVDYTTDRINPDSREDPTFLCCGSGDAGPEVITTRLSAADNGVTRIRALVLNSGNLTILLGTSPDLILQRWTWTREIVERIRPADSSAEKAAVANGDPTAFLPARDLVTDVAVQVPGRGAHGSCYLTTKGAGSPTIDTVWWYDGSGHFVPCGVRHTNSRGTWTGDRFIAPALAVVVDPREPDHVYVGTGIGVIHGVQSFVTINGVQEPRWAWSPLVNGLPESAVNDLAIFDNGAPGPVGPTGPIRLLRAALHGRGVWELDLANPLTRPRTYLRVRETDTRRRTPTALAGASFAGDTISRFDRSPDIVIDRTGSIDMGPGPYEADLWTRGGGPGPASMDTVFSARAFKVHVLVHHRWHTAAPAANVRVALLRLDVTFALGDPAVPANLWQTLVNVNAGAAVPPAVPGAWRAASAQLVRPVAAAIDTRRPRAATFDLNLAGHPNGRVMLMAVVLSGDDPITVGERLKPDGTACTTLSDFVLFSRHVAARSILLTT